MKTIRLLVSGLLALLLLAACGATPTTLATMTPIPRTPRPTATNTLTPTPTGTPLPTPTPIPAGAGTWWVQPQGVACDYSDAVSPDYHADEGDGFLNGNTWRMCTAGSGLWLRATGNSIANGFTPLNELYVGAQDAPLSETCYNSPACTCEDTSRSLASCYWVAAGAAGLLFGGGSGGLGLCGSSPTYDLQLDMTVSANCPPGPAPTPAPTPTPAAGCAITEIYTRYGATCRDYNLRGGCGTDDEFIEVKCTPAQSLAGWQLGATDVLTYTIASDNMTGPLKTFFLDQWPTWNITATLPLTGTATLINAAGATVDTRTWQTVPGYSWAAVNWTAPAGDWWYEPPSPGY